MAPIIIILHADDVNWAYKQTFLLRPGRTWPAQGTGNDS